MFSHMQRPITIALLAVIAATAGIVTTAAALSVGERPAPASAGLTPGSRDDHFRDGRAAGAAGRVADRWYLERSAPPDRIRDTWYRE